MAQTETEVQDLASPGAGLAAQGAWSLPVVSRQCRAQLGSAGSLTKVPRPCMVTIRPRSRRISMDLRIVL